MAVVLVVILLCVVSQIAMIIKFFCMCGDIKAEFEELLHLANARLPDSLNNVHSLGDIRIMFKMEKGIETTSYPNIYGLR